MTTLLQNILNKIAKLNKIYGNEAISHKKILEAIDDLQDLEKVLVKISFDLENLENQNKNTLKKNTDYLIDIHLQLQNIIWHVEQVHEIVVETIKMNSAIIAREECPL